MTRSIYHHILSAIERIEAYSEGVSFQEFLQIEILQVVDLTLPDGIE
ncbi:MAG: hypothetical protein MUE87_00555 [Methanothrix sp.]|nr:hypothetical protein [Methanothrix sp.]